MSRRSEALAERLEQGARALADFARASGDWMWEVDADLRYTWVSGAFEAVTGIPPASVIGQAISNAPLMMARCCFEKPRCVLISSRSSSGVTSARAAAGSVHRSAAKRKRPPQ